MDFNNIPWPDLNDDLLELGKDWTKHASLNYSLNEMHIYSEGYKKAADILSLKIQEDRMFIDFLIYPLVFLYRHHIELELKIIILEGNDLINNQKVERHHHKLQNLWDDAKKIIKELWPDGPQNDLQAVENVVLQLSELDPDSMSFRYDRDKEGKKPNPELKFLNVKKFSQVINNISSFFNGVGTAISVYADNKNEMGEHFLP